MLFYEYPHSKILVPENIRCDANHRLADFCRILVSNIQKNLLYNKRYRMLNLMQEHYYNAWEMQIVLRDSENSFIFGSY